MAAPLTMPLGRTATWDRAPLEPPHAARFNGYSPPGSPVYAGLLPQQPFAARLAPRPAQPAAAAPLDRTSTWDRPPLAAAPLDRTSTWDRPPAGGGLERTGTWGRPAPAGLVLGDRTSTWDRPPLAAAPLDRTSTWDRPAPAADQQPAVPLPPAATRRLVTALSRTTTWDRPAPQAAPVQYMGAAWSSGSHGAALASAPPPLVRRVSVTTAAQPPAGAAQLAAGVAPPSPGVAQLPPGASQSPAPRVVTLRRLQTAAVAAPAPAAPRPVVLRRAHTVDVGGVVRAEAPRSDALAPALAPAAAPAPPPSREELGKLLLAAAFGDWGPPQRQLRLVIAGLMGSGKSTLCRMLRHLLGGTWVNQDEFSHLKKAAKRSFLAEVGKVAADDSVPMLLVDKINTMRQHRHEILEAMDAGVAGDVALVQFRHPMDRPGQWERAKKLCEERIRARGQGHRTLMGDEPKLHNILSMTARGVEPMTPDELAEFHAVIEVDMTLEPIAVTRAALAELAGRGLLARFDVEALTTDAALAEALRVAMEAESGLKAGAAGKNGVSVGQRRRDAAEKRAQGPPPLWIYTIELSDESIAALRGVWEKYSVHVPDMSLVGDYHVTLLYLGGGSDEEIAKRYPLLGGPEAVARFRTILASSEGREVQVEARLVVWDSRVIAVEVGGDLEHLCANRHPHVTLATAPRVPPVVSNALLARRAAADDLQAGLGAWLSHLGLSEHEPALLEWCASMGAASPDEIAENAAEAAEALETVDAERRANIERTLATSMHGELCGEFLAEPLVLSGRVRAKRRGE